MKNIHILPTDKPSRLYLEFGDGDLCLANNILPQTKRSNNQHICITNDEEIKDGDWFLWQGYGGEWFKEKCEYMLYEGKKTKHLNCNYKIQFKVILTTDPDLIADGVQAIDDEFLEWFVKNPSCEEVEVDKGYRGVNLFNYKIIIPKEEPKPIHEQIIEHCGGKEKFKEITGLKPKQQTLEEVVEQELENHFFSNISEIKKAKYFINFGAKWQQEQDKNKYSEEEVMDMFDKFSMYLPLHYEFLVKEQFKKK